MKNLKITEAGFKKVTSAVNTLTILLCLSLVATKAYSVETVDSLKCSYYISSFNGEKKSARDAYILYTEFIDSIVNFSHNATISSIKGFEKDGVTKGLDSITTEFFFITRQTINILSPDYMLKRCKEHPDSTMENIGRAMFLTVQKVLSEHPSQHWKTIIDKKINTMMLRSNK